MHTASGAAPVHSREHSLVSPDHRIDGFAPECVEFLIIHLELSPHFAEHLFTTVFRQYREVIAELAEG